MAVLPPLLRVPYKVVNGVAIPTDVHLPSVKESKSLAPVLINLHGGGFMLGHAGMNNADQIQYCLDLGWIVLSAEYRLCPAVDLLEGPITDARDILRWSQNGGLSRVLKELGPKECPMPDPQRVMAMGASAGGSLALCMAWGVEQPPLAILDFYGPKCYDDAAWQQPIPALASKLPPPPPPSAFAPLFEEKEIFVGGVSLEGQSSQRSPLTAGDPNRNTLRTAFTMKAIADGRVLQTIWPKFPEHLDLIDPALNVSSNWPPTAVVHGDADVMVPIQLSARFAALLEEEGVHHEMITVVGEPHTFLGKMEKGSATWETQLKGFKFLERVLKSSYLNAVNVE
ncbi:hypothetical protein FAVG1_08770 [Fusarium avenaceum]|nr:hypothetical protein FAVG1_08770 [Fusarium avenaceum]